MTRGRGARRGGALPLLRRRAVHQGVPDEIDVPAFIKSIASGNVRGSARTIFEQNILGLLVRARLPGRGPLRGVVRLQRPGSTSPSPSGACSASRPRRRRRTCDEPLFTPEGGRRGKRVACVGAGPGVARLRGVPRARGAPGDDLREAGPARRAEHDRHRAVQAARGRRAPRGRVGAVARASRSRRASRSGATSPARSSSPSTTRCSSGSGLGDGHAARASRARTAPGVVGRDGVDRGR